MHSIKKLTVAVFGGELARRESATSTSRVRVRKEIGCEAMESRQLLNGAWGMHADAARTGTPTADVHQWVKAGASTTHTFTPPTLSASAKADMTALQADQKTLSTEIKADTNLTPLFAAVKADQATIGKALGVTAPTGAGSKGAGFLNMKDPSVAAGTTSTATTGQAGDKGFGPGGPGGPRGGFMPGGFMGAPGGAGASATLPAAIVTKLEAKGITAAQITTFEADMKAIQTEIQTVDPTLQAKIKTEETALKAAMPAPTMHFDHMRATPTSTATTSTTATSTTSTTGTSTA